MTRRSLIAGSAFALAAFARTRGMLVHLSPGAIGLKVPPGAAVDLAAKHGFESIDATIASIEAVSAKELKAKKMVWGFAGLPVEFRQDDTKFRDGMKDLPVFVRKMRAAGVERVTTWLMPTHPDLSYRENFRIHTTRLRECARQLSDNGLRFGLEYVGPKTLWASQRFPFIHTMRELRELIAEINVPDVGIVLDSFHWYEARDTVADIRALKSRDVVSVDLNDARAGVAIDDQLDGKRELPAATGVIDIKAFLGALEAIGYDGPVRAEPFNEAVRQMAPEEAVAATAAALKKAFEA